MGNRLKRIPRISVILSEQLLKSPEDMAQQFPTPSAATYRNMIRKGVRPKTLRRILENVNAAIKEHNGNGGDPKIKPVSWSEAEDVEL